MRSEWHQRSQEPGEFGAVWGAMEEGWGEMGDNRRDGAKRAGFIGVFVFAHFDAQIAGPAKSPKSITRRLACLWALPSVFLLRIPYLRSHTSITPPLMGTPDTPGHQSPSAGIIAENAQLDRKGLAKACSACSRQKVRCDGAQPCARCSSVGLTDQCIYLPSMRGRTKRRKRNPLPMTAFPGSSSLAQTTQSGADDHGLWDHTNVSASGSVRDTEPVREAVVASPSAPLARGRTASTLDKLTTTLPQNGDAHNPLSLLVELSEAISTSRHPYESPTSTLQASASKRRQEEDDYYAPLERTLKEEAPHIMALISTHE